MARFRISRIKPAGITFEMLGIEARGWPCPYCACIMTHKIDGASPTTDHVIPRSRGGPDTRANYLACCTSCNGDKANLTLFEFAGLLMAKGDVRFYHVSNVIETVIDAGGMSDNEMAAIYADIGRAFAATQRGDWPGPATAQARRRPVTAEQIAELSRLEIEWVEKKRRMAEFVLLDRLKIPRSHWTFEPPNTVRVILGSKAERFLVHQIDLLHAEIATHPRFSYLAQAAE